MAGIELDELMRAAGASLGGAQGKLLSGVASAPTAMAIAEATLDMKITVESVAKGALQVVPVSAAGARAGAVEVGALSSVLIRFVAFGDETPGHITGPTPVGTSAPVTNHTPTPTPAPKAGQPVTRAAAERELQRRPDIAKLMADGVVLRFEGVRAGANWVVLGRQPDGKIVASATFAAKD